jgi:hypothetical protein
MNLDFSQPFSIRKGSTEYINIKGYSLEVTYRLQDIKEINIDIFYKKENLNLIENYIWRDVNNKLSKDTYKEVYSFRNISIYIKIDSDSYLLLIINIKETLVLHRNKETNISYYCLSRFHKFVPYKYNECFLKKSIDTKELRTYIGPLSKYHFDKDDIYLIIPNEYIPVYKPTNNNNLYKLDRVSLNFLYWHIDSDTIETRLLKDNFKYIDIWKSIGTQVTSIIPQSKLINPEEEDPSKYLYLIQ